VVVTPTHATAAAIAEQFGGDVVVQVIPIAPPQVYLAAEDSAARRAALGVPDRYILTTATACETGRLSWIFDALEGDPELPALVVLADAAVEADAGDAQATSPDDAEPEGEADTPSEAAKPDAGTADAIAVPQAIRDRVHVVQPRELADIGAVLAGAELLAVPQQLIGSGYEVLGALAAGVPIVHAECAACSELALDAGVGAETAEEFAAALGRLSRDAGERERLRVFAEDRSRTFSWSVTARLLWELPANI